MDDSTRTASVDYSIDKRVTDAIKNVSPSVVAIVGNYRPEYMSQQALSYNESYAYGTGVIIRNNGTILTNAHVVKDIENITVILANGESYSGSVMYTDETSDLAVVKINKLGLSPISFGSMQNVAVGSTVIAIGTPISLNMMNTATKGIVSGKNVNIGKYYYFTQSDVTINGGNSGGPLIDLNGNLIGINSIKYAGIGVEGMSFSIPIETINYVLAQFDANGKVLRPDLGITFTEPWTVRQGFPSTKGLSVKLSSNDSVKVGDILNTVNGVTVHSITDYNEALKNTYTAGIVTLGITRANESLVVKITPTLK